MNQRKTQVVAKEKQGTKFKHQYSLSDLLKKRQTIPRTNAKICQGTAFPGTQMSGKRLITTFLLMDGFHRMLDGVN
jgi:hypothetical protein